MHPNATNLHYSENKRTCGPFTRHGDKGSVIFYHRGGGGGANNWIEIHKIKLPRKQTSLNFCFPL